MQNGSGAGNCLGLTHNAGAGVGVGVGVLNYNTVSSSSAAGVLGSSVQRHRLDTLQPPAGCSPAGTQHGVITSSAGAVTGQLPTTALDAVSSASVLSAPHSASSSTSHVEHKVRSGGLRKRMVVPMNNIKRERLLRIHTCMYYKEGF